MFNRNTKFHMECLEDRRLMAGDAMAFFNGASLTNTVPVAETVSYWLPPSGTTGTPATHVYDPSLLSEPDLDVFMGLPMLDSNPGAPKTLFLDFTGHSQNTFSNHRGTFPQNGLPIVTPAYDTTFDPTVFSAQEKSEIKQIWARVAEDYAPFNINVTTRYYGALTDGKVLKVAIGGHPTDWYIDWQTSADTPSGTSSDGSFTDPNKPNVVFVFSNDIISGSNSGEKDNDFRSINVVAAVSNTASHEAGHAFGLEHIAKYVKGKKVDSYDGGTAEWSPIMGDNLASDRTTWAYGPTAAGPKVFQNDVQILGSVLGLRSDDHVSSRIGATQLTTSNSAALATPLTGKGIIEWQADVDMFKFTSPGGPVKVQVKAAEFGPNMWVKTQLWNETGFVAMGASGVSNFESTVSANVPAGTYYVVVQGQGGYGHLGQYTVSVKHDAPLSKNPTVKGGTVVGPVGPIAPTKTTSATTKGTSTISTETSKMSASDGKSNDPVLTTPTNSPLVLDGIMAKAKQTLPSLTLKTDVKDAAFDSLYTDSLRR